MTTAVARYESPALQAPRKILGGDSSVPFFGGAPSFDKEVDLNNNKEKKQQSEISGLFSKEEGDNSCRSGGESELEESVSEVVTRGQFVVSEDSEGQRFADESKPEARAKRKAVVGLKSAVDAVIFTMPGVNLAQDASDSTRPGDFSDLPSSLEASKSSVLSESKAEGRARRKAKREGEAKKRKSVDATHVLLGLSVSESSRLFGAENPREMKEEEGTSQADSSGNKDREVSVGSLSDFQSSWKPTLIHKNPKPKTLDNKDINHDISELSLGMDDLQKDGISSFRRTDSARSLASGVSLNLDDPAPPKKSKPTSRHGRSSESLHSSMKDRGKLLLQSDTTLRRSVNSQGSDPIYRSERLESLLSNSDKKKLASQRMKRTGVARSKDGGLTHSVIASGGSIDSLGSRKSQGPDLSDSYHPPPSDFKLVRRSTIESADSAPTRLSRRTSSSSEDTPKIMVRRASNANADGMISSSSRSNNRQGSVESFGLSSLKEASERSVPSQPCERSHFNQLQTPSMSSVHSNLQTQPSIEKHSAHSVNSGSRKVRFRHSTTQDDCDYDEANTQRVGILGNFLGWTPFRRYSKRRLSSRIEMMEHQFCESHLADVFALLKECYFPR